MKNNMSKVLLLITLSMGMTALAGCGNEQAQAQSPVIATYKGHKLTQEQWYKELKAMPNNRTALANLLLYRALNQKYGAKVSAKQVDEEYTTYRRQYGSQFSSFLSQNNLTPKVLRRTLRLNLLGEAALKAQQPVSSAELKAAWKDYKPTLSVQAIKTTDESTALVVINALNAGQDFSKLASQYSVDTATKDNGGKLTVTPTDKNLDSTFKDAAYNLKVGDYTTTPVKVTDGYVVIKSLKNPGKGTMSEHKLELENTVYNSKLKDSATMRNVFSKTLKDEKVTIKDKDLSSVLSMYISQKDDNQ